MNNFLGILIMSKPGKVLRNLCKRLKVRLTTKRNGKRVYKSVKVLKEQCKKKKKVKKKKVKRKFGATIIEEEEHLEETVILAKKSGLSTEQIIGIILGVIGAGLFTGLGYYIGSQSKNKFGSTSDEEEKCSICLDPLSEYPTKQLNACKHIFHKDCIEGWRTELHNQGLIFSCPLCRGYSRPLPYIKENNDDDDDNDNNDRKPPPLKRPKKTREDRYVRGVGAELTFD